MSSKIIRLDILNFKKITAVHIEPKGSTVIVAGKNKQGKSTVLDAIQAALEGRKSLPEDPIRHGARKAEIVLDIGDVTVSRTFTKKGTKLEVRGANGKIASPQAALDSLTQSLTFDPLAFQRMESKERARVLRELAGLDTSEEEAKIAETMETRRAVKREAKALDAKAGAGAPHPGAPLQKTPMSEVLARLDEATASQRAAHEAQEVVRKRSGKALESRQTVEKIEAQIERLQARLEEWTAARTKEEEAVRCAVAEAETLEAASRVHDHDDIRQELDTLEDTNAKVEANHKHEELVAEHRAKEDEVDRLTETIDELREAVSAKIEAASFPVDGLAVDDDGVVFDGVPFEQASGAERLKVSAAIGLALNPDLRILLIRDGSLLDDDSMAALEVFAEENDAQVWIECVGHREGAAIEMVDGHASDDGDEF